MVLEAGSVNGASRRGTCVSPPDGPSSDRPLPAVLTLTRPCVPAVRDGSMMMSTTPIGPTGKPSSTASGVLLLPRKRHNLVRDDLGGRYEPIKGYVGYEDADGNVAVIGGPEALEYARCYEPFPVFRRVTPRRMMELGVEGDPFHEHDEDECCRAAGCIPADSDAGNLARFGRLID